MPYTKKFDILLQCALIFENVARCFNFLMFFFSTGERERERERKIIKKEYLIEMVKK